MFSSPSLLNGNPGPARDSGYSCSHSLSRQSNAAAFGWHFLIRQLQGEHQQFASDQEVETRRSLKMAKVEAVLFVADCALSSRKISQLATLANAAEAIEIIDKLNATFTATNSAFHIKRVATGYQMMTQPQYAFWLNKLHQRQAALKLSAPAMETLAMVVYRQPITRADIESIRGVQSAEMLKQLMDRGLVRINGKDDSLGRPFLYESTRKFLEIFGLKSLDELPMGETLRIRPSQHPEAISESESEPDTELPPNSEINLLEEENEDTHAA
ncbi:SMC-Scp complex subunit ScpB [uncultured Gimesia sp.]|jgi:segregation and condensation protein B|uniref:SMC-Scp complex subunit ScpB n=1 Tax=uncultured Gimesia sp. TaxID=1678688 RepID=UPI00262BCB0A|nr:SMC-Scp complex subunit ScpB [uncultured Gimesia sp.]